MYSEARAEFALAVPKGCPACLPALEYPSILIALGEREAAQKAMRDYPQEGKRPFEQALVFALLGQKDQALQILERIVDNPDRTVDLSLIILKVDPEWDSLREDPRFQDLLRRMNLPLE